MRRALSIPSAPVPTLLTPLFTTTAWSRPAWINSRPTTTGAPGTRLLVKTPAAAPGISEAKRERSRADGLMPQWTEAQRKPAGSRGSSSNGRSVIALNYEGSPENEGPPGGHEVDEYGLREHAVRDGARTDCGKSPIGDLGAPHKERHIFDRLPTVPTLFLLLSLSLAACAGAEGPTGPSGPTGPAGEAGPGTRIVLSGDYQLPGSSGFCPADVCRTASTRSRFPQRSPGHDVLDITRWCGLVQ